MKRRCLRDVQTAVDYAKSLQTGFCVMNILIVEDDTENGRYLERGLQEAGWQPVWHNNPQAAMLTLSGRVFDVIVLDRMLPGMDGVDALRLMRGANITTPVLMLTARTSIADRVEGLEAGADDYLLNPYRPDTFLRFISVYLRPSESSKPHLRFADLTLDLGQRLAVREQQPISLTMKEFELLKYLMEHPGEVLSREQILENVWGYNFMGESNVIEVYVRYLRLKLEDGDRKRIIQTVRGIGYVLREP